MVDIHCHILPGIDDGSKSWEMTAEMCRIAARDGITHIVATPHSNDVYDYNRERFTEMLGQLHDSADGKLTFSLGCDFHFSYDNIQDAMNNPRRYTIGDSQYLLIEFSDYGIPPSVKQDVFRHLQLRHDSHHHSSRAQPAAAESSRDRAAVGGTRLPGPGDSERGDRILGSEIQKDGGVAAEARGDSRDRQRCA